MAEHLESLAALERTLKAAPGQPSTLELEQMETRVDRVIAQMARGAYDEAARASESLWREGVQDVRLVTPSLFGAFLAHGPRSRPPESRISRARSREHTPGESVEPSSVDPAKARVASSRTSWVSGAPCPPRP